MRVRILLLSRVRIQRLTCLTVWLLANTLYKPCILCNVVIVSYAQNLWCYFSHAHILCTIFNTPTVFLKSFFCRGGDKEADRRRKIRCLHIHSRVDGGRGLLTVLAVGGGKGMLTVLAFCIWSILFDWLWAFCQLMLVCGTVKFPMVGKLF